MNSFINYAKTYIVYDVVIHFFVYDVLILNI